MRSTFSRRYYFNETESQSQGNITKSKEIWRFLLLNKKFIRTPSFLLLIFFGKPKKLINVNCMIAKKKSFVLMYRSNFHLLPRSTFC